MHKGGRPRLVILWQRVVITASLFISVGCTDQVGPATTRATSTTATTDPGMPDRPVAIATSSWDPRNNDFSMGGEFRGWLVKDAGNCPLLTTSTGESLAVVWPSGYTAAIRRDGSLGVYAPGSVLVARTGRRVTFGGGLGNAPEPQAPCIDRNADGVAYVQEDLTASAGS